MRIFLIFSILSIYSVFSQENDKLFINYTEINGLNDDQITGVTQDRRGFYWISTINGFSRFDGKLFKKYYPSDFNLKYSDYSTVYFESKKNYLILTIGNGKAFQIDCINQTIEKIKNFENRTISDFYRISENQIAVATIDTAFIVDNDFNILKKIIPPTITKGTNVIVRPLSDTKLFINSTHEQFIYDTKTKEYSLFNHSMNVSNLYNSGYTLLDVNIENKCIFFSNYFYGLYKLDFSGNVIYHWTNSVSEKNKITGSPIKIIHDPKNQNLVWIAGNNGISSLNIFTHQTENYLLNKNEGFSNSNTASVNLFFDNQAILWTSTNNGVFKSNNYSKFIRTWDLGINVDEPITSIIKADNDIYATKYYKGVYKINSETNSSINNSELFLPIHLINSWFILQNGNCLIHGGKGIELTEIDLFSKNINKRKILSPYFKTSTVLPLGFRHSNGDIWISGNNGGGIVKIHSKTNTIEHFSKEKGSFSLSYFTHYVEDKNGDLWLSSNKSSLLVHWKKNKNEFEEIDFKKVNSDFIESAIQCISTNNRGDLWIGLNGGGVLKFNPITNENKVFSKNQGLPSNYVYSITVDASSRVWIGTNKGLACLFPDEKTTRNFTLGNGFPSDKFEGAAFYDKKNNQLWIAATNCLINFNPDDILNNKRQKLSLFIDEFKLNNRNLENFQNKQLKFKTSENNIFISFVSLNFNQSKDVLYSYKLKGSKNKWIEIGPSDRINLLNLHFGEYTFYLRAKYKGEDNWVYLNKPIYFIIATPWYESWWFLLLSLLLSFAIIYFIFRLSYLRKIGIQQSKLDKQKAIQIERDRIAFDMHDDLGSGLTKIAYLSQKLLAEHAENQLEISKINKTSLELIESMSELIWAMKIENDSIQDLLNYIKQYTIEYLELNSILLKLNIPNIENNLTISGEKRRNILLIIKEALHNIVKHSSATMVNFSVHIDHKINITINDNGTGIGVQNNETNELKGNGIVSMKKRTEKLDGNCIINSSKYGTTILIEIPIN